jgi:hypothetical protein
MSYDPSRGNENIADVVSLEPYASAEQVRDALINVIRWLGDREPVAPGDRFLKFTTAGQLVSLGVINEGDILGDDNGGEDDDGTATEPEYVVVHAREMYPSVTNGCDALAVAEITSAKPNIQYLAFPPLSDTSADFQLIMPFGWPGNAFQFRVYWSHPTGATTYGVTWKLQAHSATDDEAIGSDFADGGQVDDDGGTTDDLYITAESSPITISGINAKAGDLIFLRITRLAASSANDDLNVVARLHAIRFNLGEAPVEFPDEGLPFTVFFAEEAAPSATVTGTPVTERASFLSYLSGVTSEGFEGFTASNTAQAVSITRNGTTCTIKQLISEYDGGFTDIEDVEYEPKILDLALQPLVGRFNTTASGANWLDMAVETGNDASAPSGIWEGRYRASFSFSVAISAFGFYGTDFGDFTEGRRVMADLTLSGGGTTTVEITDDITSHADGNLIFWGFIDGDSTYTKVVIYVEQTTSSSAEGLGIDDIVFCTSAYLA